jgi:transposase
VRGEPIYEDIREKIRVSAVVHADETSWRNDGQGNYAWFAGNEKLAFFHIDPSRSAMVAKSIFGEAFDGILVRDRYAAYNGIASNWQSCLSHVITKAKQIKREHELLPQSEQEQATYRFCDQVISLFKDACDKARLLKTKELPWDKAGGIEKNLVKRLFAISKKPLAFKPAETLRAYLTGDDQKYLFTFLRYPGVPPTNNHAEQSIRHLVIFRKLSFGTRSQSGPKVHSILLSLVQTARRQAVDPRQFLQTLLTASTSSAQTALYNNST